MTKPEALGLLQLLSALESWGFSNNHRLPNYLHDRLLDSVELLRKEGLMLPRTRKHKLTDRLRNHLWGYLGVGGRFRVVVAHSRWVWNHFYGDEK